MQDLRVILDDEPGALAALGEALGGSGINVEGGYVATGDGKAEAHFLVEDAGRVLTVLESAGFPVDDQREAIAIYVSGVDRPGVLGRYARRIAEAGVNIERTYITSGSRLAFVTSDNAKARAALKG